MSIFKCPTNCENHDYFFPHSVIMTTRLVNRVLVVTEFVVCRECGHWISRRYEACRCRYHCHEQEGGITVLMA
jgi:hypothetical protein